MKKVFVPTVALVAALLLSASVTCGQGRAKNGPDPSIIRDVDLEKDSLHNLEVAKHYFKLKKAYVAAIMRCEEIDTANPNFAKMDEVLYIAGESSLKLAENRGKQKSKGKTAEELKQDARVYFTRLVAGYPNSAFYKQAETDLEALGGPIKLESTTP